MISKQAHKIGRQNIQVRYAGLQDSLQLQALMAELSRNEFPKLLERLLDEIDDAKTVTRIPKLELDFEVEENGLSLEMLKSEILKKAEGFLREKLENCEKKRNTVEHDFVQAWKYFLQKGYLPIWSIYKNQKELQQALELTLGNSKDLPDFSEILEATKEENARARLLKMLSRDSLKILLLVSKIFTKKDWNFWVRLIGILEDNFGKNVLLEETFRVAIIKYSAAQRNVSTEAERALQFGEVLRKEIQKIYLPNSNKFIEKIQDDRSRKALLTIFAAETELLEAKNKRRVSSKEKEPLTDAHKVGEKPLDKSTEIDESKQSQSLKDADKIDEGSRILIHNSGLVILAPFLPQLFKNLELDLVEPNAEFPKAIAIFRYLVFGKEHFDESEAVLEKIFLGLPLSKSIENAKELSTQVREQCETLLQSVIEHWSILKNTSPDGLRQSFLQREGILEIRNERWTLTVQKESIDMLLDRLPWGMNIIKTPWMQTYFTVHW
ncbi:MAG: contractile injection system tape measure protein [Chitinophagaceae bacterium]